jgi:hypothetical protein
MHPLVINLAEFKTNEIESKIADLSKKYFMTSNPGIQTQIISILEVYQEELSIRRKAEWDLAVESRNKGLDKLINVS